MQPFFTLTFDSEKILTSALRDVDDGAVEYTTQTVKNGSSRQTTSLQLERSPGTPQAVIHWKQNCFEISGSRRDIGELKMKRATFSSSRYWTWFDNEEYKVKYAAETGHTWTVSSYDGTVLATFTSNIHRFFNENSRPILRLSASISDEDEQQFIILVLLYSETKRLESIKQRPLSVMF
ncbi:hypothetical protein C8R43DRAFT_1108119 [Mycena crocata]|nr:hypothetical protein C8R43DRAFT_1108119 [Mycena crocata]